jgi:hypothetical protein
MPRPSSTRRRWSSIIALSSSSLLSARKLRKEGCCRELTPPAASQPNSGRTASSLLRYALRASAQHMNPCAVCRRPENTNLRTTASSLRLRLLALELPRPRTPVSSGRPRQAPAQQRLSSTPQIRGAGAVPCANAPGLGYHVAKFRNSSIVPRLAAGVIKPAAARGNPNGGLSHASRASSPSSGTPQSLPSQSGWGVPPNPGRGGFEPRSRPQPTPSRAATEAASFFLPRSKLS